MKYRQVRRNPGASDYCTQFSSGVKSSRDPFVTMCVTTVSLAQNIIKFHHGHERAEVRGLPEMKDFVQQ